MIGTNENTHDEIKQNGSGVGEQVAIGGVSTTVGEETQIDADGGHSATWMHPLDAHLLMRIKFGHELMCAEGNDAEWPSASCGSVRYASELECMEQDDYNGMMAWLYGEEEDCRDGIYFCAPSDGYRREGIFGG